MLYNIMFSFVCVLLKLTQRANYIKMFLNMRIISPEKKVGIF